MIEQTQAIDLMESARKATEQSYAPYSKFPVGAALLSSDGRVFTGCNVENASYPLSVCAERVAIGVAVASGCTEIVAVAVSAPLVASVTPCGGCRQVLNEFKPVAADMDIVLEGDNDIEIVPLSSLLPRSFGPSDLE